MSQVELKQFDLSKLLGDQFAEAKVGEFPEGLKVTIVNDQYEFPAKHFVITKEIVAIANVSITTYAEIQGMPKDFDFDAITLSVDDKGELTIWDEVPKHQSQHPVLAEQYEAAKPMVIKKKEEKPSSSSPILKYGFIAVVVLTIGFFAHQQGLLPFGSKAQKV